MSISISCKNSKLGGAIPSVNLPPIITCRPDAPCRKLCYACKGNFRFENVKNSINKNLNIYLKHPNSYFNDIDSMLNLVPYKYFRYHSSGDIPDIKYLELMCKTARKHKTTKFLCFTKQYEIVNKYISDKHIIPSNLVIVFSNWGDWQCENPYNLPTAWVELAKQECSIPANARKCNGHCANCVDTNGSCWNMKRGDSVFFHQH